MSIGYEYKLILQKRTHECSSAKIDLVMGGTFIKVNEHHREVDDLWGEERLHDEPSQSMDYSLDLIDEL